MHFIIWALIIIFGTIFMVSSILILLVVRIVFYDEKLIQSLPVMTWMTLEDVRTMGLSTFYARLLLSMYHREGMLEVRKRTDLNSIQEFEVRQYGFVPTTIQCYEFKLIQRPPRRKKFDFRSQFQFKPAARPATA